MLRAHFSYESFVQSFLHLHFRFKLFWRKCAHKMLVKLTKGDAKKNCKISNMTHKLTQSVSNSVNINLLQPCVTSCWTRPAARSTRSSCSAKPATDDDMDQRELDLVRELEPSPWTPESNLEIPSINRKFILIA
jgi:hypothetical protein